MSVNLRPYQVRGIDALFAAFRQGKRLVAPTGLSEIVRRHRAHPRGGRVLVVVHRTELVSDDDRVEALDAFARGAVEVLANVFVLTEGWDCPRAEVCILARGCDHVGTFLQMVGRVLRPHPGKVRALLIDLRGVVHKHGCPDELRQFSLEGRAISGAAPTKDCPQCGAEVALGVRLCEECRYEFPQRSIDFAPLRRLTVADRERLAFKHALGLARSRGWSDGYAVHRFRERFGRNPWGLWRAFGCASKRKDGAA
jgi:superfamily II DNA or RNA helicase